MKALNVTGLKYQLKTVYAGRASQTPLLSVSKGGANLNTAFDKKYLGCKGSDLFYQVVNTGGKDYLLLSRKKLDHFYTACSIKNGSRRGGYNLSQRTLMKAYGNQKETVRYEMVEVPTSDKSVRAFMMKRVALDKFISTESSDFETHE